MINPSISNTNINFPDVLIAKILSYSDIKTLGRACLVCKKWKEISSLDQIWRPQLKKLLKGFYWKKRIAKLNSPIKVFLDNHSVISFQGLVSKFESLVNKTLPDTKCQYAGYFPTTNEKLFEVIIGYGMLDRLNTSELKLENCILCMKDLPLSERAKPEHTKNISVLTYRSTHIDDLYQKTTARNRQKPTYHHPQTSIKISIYHPIFSENYEICVAQNEIKKKLLQIIYKKIDSIRAEYIKPKAH